jgi:phosphate transport system protein
MSPAFTSVISGLRGELAEMVRMTGDAMGRATDSLLNADLETAQSVIAADRIIDDLNARIDDRSVRLVSTMAPADSEVREILSILRVATSAERMGDLAVHIAKSARLRYPDTAVPPAAREIVREMGELAEKLAAEAADVLETQDARAAADLKVADERLDALHRRLFNLVLSPEWNDGIEAAVDLTLISRFFERFGDHCVSIADRAALVATDRS